MADEIELWRWQYTDEFGKRRTTSWLMTEDHVCAFAHIYRDAVKVEWTREVRRSLGLTSDFMRSKPPS